MKTTNCLLTPGWRRGLRCRAVAILLSTVPVLVSLHAQTAPATPSVPPSSDDTVKLPTFNVNSEKDTSYEGAESVSLTRTGVNIQDLDQSITIINRSYMDAVAPTSFAWMVQAAGGGQVGNLPIYETTDRFVLRGFTSMGDFVDGFLTINAEASTLNYVDHLEIVKGPAAIMSTNAAGVVGGAVNKVTVNPTENPEGTLSFEYGRYDTGSANLDVGGAVTPDKKLLFRVLGEASDFNGYEDWQYLKRRDVMPMLLYNFSDTTQAWIKAEYTDDHYGSYNGLALDGRTNLPAAVPLTTNWGENDPDNWRWGVYSRIWGQFTTRPNEHVAIRLAAFDSTLRYWGTETVLTPSGATAATLQPNGSYAFAPYAQYEIPPTYVTGSTIPRTTEGGLTDTPRREVQNDYAFNFDTGPVSHSLLVGLDASDFPAISKSWNNSSTSTASSTAINPFGNDKTWEYAPVSVNYNLPPVSFQDTAQNYAKMYVLETVELWDKRILLTYGASRHRFESSSETTPFNQITNTYGAETYVPSNTLYKNLVQYGAVVKPIPHVSVFYGQNSNFTANGLNPTNTAFLPPGQGNQYETGIKTDIIPSRITLNVSYFDITQINNSVPAYPQTIPPSQVLIPGETSRGFDGDFTFNITHNLSVTGSFADFKAHVQESYPDALAPQPYDGLAHLTIPVNNVSQHNFYWWGHYTFTDTALKGLTIGGGTTTLAKRAITDSSNQIFFGYIPGYTLLNGAISYSRKHYVIQLNVDNITNKFYWYASRDQLILFPGTPINPRMSVTYKY